MSSDITFEQGLVESLGRSVAAVVEHALKGMVPEQGVALTSMLAAKTAIIIVTVRMEPFEVTGVVHPVDPTSGAEFQLFRIEGGPR